MRNSAMVEHANVRGVAVPAIELVYAALLPQERVAEARAGRGHELRMQRGAQSGK